jgi:hypothetical protein
VEDAAGAVHQQEAGHADQQAQVQAGQVSDLKADRLHNFSSEKH